MKKKCQRCSENFECSDNKIENCSCKNIELTKESKNYLSKTNYDCLCTNCLEEINNYSNLEKQYPFPNHPSKYIEGIHYYIEGNYWVFTNYYHYLKGSCCKNNCRHCAYGFGK